MFLGIYTLSCRNEIRDIAKDTIEEYEEMSLGRVDERE